jgi:SUMO ligase MMS21 Smc5/6 complex component
MGKVVNFISFLCRFENYKLVNNKQIKEYINMEKKIFTDKETTKEQYLKFKEFIKSDAFKDHSDYVAYYIFKHRIEGADRDAYLEDEVKNRCYKALYSGRLAGSGGEMTENYAIPTFKRWVIKVYNKYADPTEE